ncbi:OB-fold protein [Polyangium mundeleinium]|uniref:DUF5666 domain-containing protein n=1 Tax=Polyangium mundeleinium TaxID=2995306 RepID=A0ABT5EZ84_9BACT|nr:hypothetical protein [Polyangium mundeleinium]MDC0747091.1 hypothetical protein [Polyangium mundeleinium]
MARRCSWFWVALVAFGVVSCSRTDNASREGAAAASASAAPAPPAAPSIRTNPPEVEISHVELLEAYEASATRADERFKGKHVLVRGKLGEVVKDGAKVVVTMPKEAKPDAPSVRCLVRESEAAEITALKPDDPVDVVGKLVKFDKHVEIEGCVVNTQVKACRVVAKALGRGTCEQDREELGARLVLGAEQAALVCGSPSGFEAWRAKTSSLPAQERAGRMISVDTSSCHLTHESLSPRLAVEFSSALARVRWENDVPTLAP